MKNFKENPDKEETRREKQIPQKTSGTNAEVLIRSSIQDTITLIASIMVVFVLLATISIIPPRGLVIEVLWSLPLFTILDCDIRAIFNAIKMRYWSVLIGYLGIFINIIATIVLGFISYLKV